MPDLRRKRLVAQLDTIFSLFIRLRDKKAGGYCCPLCGQGDLGRLQCFHFISRSKHAVRWDPENAIAACGGCNIRYEHEQEFVEYVIDFYKATLGPGKWDELKQRSHIIPKFSVDDLRSLKADLELMLERVNVEKVAGVR